jgi:hypothetical protein
LEVNLTVVSAAQPLLERPLADDQQSAGEPIPPKYEVIEVHVAELRQLFNAIDPSPFREKDLDINVEEFIVEWARNRAMQN